MCVQIKETITGLQSFKDPERQKFLEGVNWRELCRSMVERRREVGTDSSFKLALKYVPVAAMMLTPQMMVEVHRHI